MRLTMELVRNLGRINIVLLFLRASCERAFGVSGSTECDAQKVKTYI